MMAGFTGRMAVRHTLAFRKTVHRLRNDRVPSNGNKTVIAPIWIITRRLIRASDDDVMLITPASCRVIRFRISVLSRVLTVNKACRREIANDSNNWAYRPCRFCWMSWSCRQPYKCCTRIIARFSEIAKSHAWLNTRSLHLPLRTCYYFQMRDVCFTVHEISASTMFRNFRVIALFRNYRNHFSQNEQNLIFTF